jgi:hypothetical protein
MPYKLLIDALGGNYSSCNKIRENPPNLRHLRSIHCNLVVHRDAMNHVPMGYALQIINRCIGWQLFILQ